MKRLSVSFFALMMISNTVFANSQNQSSKFDGFYGQAGVVGQKSTTSRDQEYVIGGRTYAFSSHEDAIQLTVSGALGYNFAVTNAFKLGIGAEVNPSRGSFDNNYRNAFSVFISPGVTYHENFHLYGKIGQNAMQLKSHFNDTEKDEGYMLGLGLKKHFEKFYGFIEGNYIKQDKNLASNNQYSDTYGARVYNAVVGVGCHF